MKWTVIALAAAVAASASPAAACGFFDCVNSALADDAYPLGVRPLHEPLYSIVKARNDNGLSLAGFYNDPALALANRAYAAPAYGYGGPVYAAPPPPPPYGYGPPPGPAYVEAPPAPAVLPPPEAGYHSGYHPGYRPGYHPARHAGYYGHPHGHPHAMTSPYGHHAAPHEPPYGEPRPHVY